MGGVLQAHAGGVVCSPSSPHKFDLPLHLQHCYHLKHFQIALIDLLINR